MSKSSHSDSIHTSESLTEATSNEGSQMLTGKKSKPQESHNNTPGQSLPSNEGSQKSTEETIKSKAKCKQISEKIYKDKKQYHNLMVAAANSQVLGIFTVFQRSTLILKYCCENKCLAFIIIFGFIAALTTLLSGIIFAISTTPQTPGLMPINSNSFNIDPLTPCGVGDASCPVLLQDRFRFMWLQGASDVLINGITKQLSVNWGDDPGGERKVMVAVVDNDTSINYKFVKDNKKSVPVFSLSTICNNNTPPNFPGFRTPYHNLTMTDRINLSLAVEMDSLLENRWIAEVINLQQDDLNETTIMTVNIVKILSLNSKCEGISIDTAKFKLCYPEISKNITCYMNTHVENVESVSAGCKGDCPVIGFRFTNSARVNYSSPKPVYGDYMHKSLAIYGGNILIPQCIDNLVGCVNYNENNASQVKDRFVELLYGITASGVMARRSLLSNNGTIVNVQSVVKGKAGVILKFEEGYYITVFGLVGLCFVAYLVWHWHCIDLKWCTCEYEYNFNHKHQITNYWLLDKENDSETEKAEGESRVDILLNILLNILINLSILAIYSTICRSLYHFSYYKIMHDEA